MYRRPRRPRKTHLSPKRRVTLYPLAARSLTALLMVFSAGCDAYTCELDELDRDSACEEITETADRRLEQCGLPGFTELLCEPNCISLDGIECEKDAQVERCKSAIAALPCDLMQVDTILHLSECVYLFNSLEEACADADDDDDDDDWDDDWD